MPVPLQLPAPKPVIFRRTPLSLVVCQLRFEDTGPLPEESASGLRDRFATRYPLAQRLQSAEVHLGPAGVQAAATGGMRFASVAGDWTCSLFPDFVSLETTAYSDWQDFDSRLREMLAAVVDVVHPRVETRLGLRYVNEIQIDDVRAPSDWLNYLNPALVSELSPTEPLAASLLTLHQMMQVDIGEGGRLTLRHGLPGEATEDGDKALTYLLDLDCFRQSQRLLVVDDVMSEADRLNTAITSMFQWCLQESLWEELDPRDK